jgi:selenocysteine lyase/cysteine desulfurase
MMGADESLANDIRKFEQIGTHPASQRNAIAEAMNFHESIGAERKAERFRYLRRRWSDELRKLPGVKILNSDDPAQSCGIGFVSVEGIEASKLVGHLWNKYRIWTTSFNSPGEYQGLRITPNVYSTIEEIDTFTEAMTEVVKHGIPA